MARKKTISIVWLMWMLQGIGKAKAAQRIPNQDLRDIAAAKRTGSRNPSNLSQIQRFRKSTC